MLTYVAFLPMYALMPFLYNDMLTFGIITQAFSILRSAYDNENKYIRYLKYCLAGLILGVGILIKFTIIIQIIALVIIGVLYKKFTKKLPILTLTLSTCIVLWIGNAYVDSREFVQVHSKTENPVSAWIATGLSEDGSFAAAYGEFIREMYTFETKEEKDAFCKEYIKDNYKKLYSISHIYKKTKRAYGLSTFGASEYNITPEIGYEANRIYEYFSVHGKKYHIISDIVCAYFGAILVIYILGISYGIYLLVKRKESVSLIDIAELSFVGYFFFQMLSETSHHQIFNLMPLLIVGVVLQVSRLAEIRCFPQIRNNSE